MARPKGSRNKPKEFAVAAPAGTAHIEVASIAQTPPEAADALRREIDDLRAKLKEAEAGRTDAEKRAIAAAEAQGILMQGEIQEIPTGKKKAVRRFKEWKVKGHKDNGDEIAVPVFETRMVPVYAYKIDLPTSGGMYLSINGVNFYHGTVYELDVDTLRSVKEIIYRGWDHERNIRGSNENAYRRKEGAVFGPRGRLQ